MGISFEFGTLARHTACGIYSTSAWHVLVRGSILGPCMLWVPMHVGVPRCWTKHLALNISDIVYLLWGMVPRTLERRFEICTSSFTP